MTVPHPHDPPLSAPPSRRSARAAKGDAVAGSQLPERSPIFEAVAVARAEAPSRTGPSEVDAAVAPAVTPPLFKPRLELWEAPAAIAATGPRVQGRRASFVSVVDAAAPRTESPGIHQPQPQPRHRARRATAPWLTAATIAFAALLVCGGSASVTMALTNQTPASLAAEAALDEPSIDAAIEGAVDDAQTPPPPPLVEALPTQAPQPAAVALCDDPNLTAALAARDGAAVISASGGAFAMRLAVASGVAPCIPLDDPSYAWVVINKQRSFSPIDYRPASLVMPDGVRSLEGGALRDDAAAGMAALVAAAREAGVGELAVESAFRSYTTQQTTYGNQVASRGVDGADAVSARPGYSEHQSGLAADVVACDGGCSSLDDLAGTPQGEWVAAHSWEHGWVVRYEEGHTDVSGYLPEPWHLRFIGVELARAYHDAGFHTLEEFWGLPAAPAYAD